jgi:hypothetical protein
MQVVALISKEHLKQADVVSENSCEAVQRLWRVKLGTCSKLFISAGDFSTASWKYCSLAMSLLTALADRHRVQKGVISFEHPSNVRSMLAKKLIVFTTTTILGVMCT